MPTLGPVRRVASEKQRSKEDGMKNIREIRVLFLAIAFVGAASAAAHAGCGEATCYSTQGTYISHFTGAGCSGTEYYYLPYDGYGYQCRPGLGARECGTTQYTVTSRSYFNNGNCYDAWPSGNTLSEFVRVYSLTCGEAVCNSAQGSYISHYTGANCTGVESYYLPYDGNGYSCRSWNGGGECGTSSHTVTNRSYKYLGTCYNAWPSGNTLSQFVTIYR
jgi:hypothetical protein